MQSSILRPAMRGSRNGRKAVVDPLADLAAALRGRDSGLGLAGGSVAAGWHGTRRCSSQEGDARRRGAGGAPNVCRMCSSVEASSSCVASRVASPRSQRRVAARLSAVQHSSARLYGAPCSWRDPDSNRGRRLTDRSSTVPTVPVVPADTRPGRIGRCIRYHAGTTNGVRGVAGSMLPSEQHGLLRPGWSGPGTLALFVHCGNGGGDGRVPELL